MLHGSTFRNIGESLCNSSGDSIGTLGGDSHGEGAHTLAGDGSRDGPVDQDVGSIEGACIGGNGFCGMQGSNTMIEYQYDSN